MKLKRDSSVLTLWETVGELNLLQNVNVAIPDDYN